MTKALCRDGQSTAGPCESVHLGPPGLIEMILLLTPGALLHPHRRVQLKVHLYEGMRVLKAPCARLPPATLVPPAASGVSLSATAEETLVLCCCLHVRHVSTELYCRCRSSSAQLVTKGRAAALWDVWGRMLITLKAALPLSQPLNKCCMAGLWPFVILLGGLGLLMEKCAWCFVWSPSHLLGL